MPRWLGLAPAHSRNCRAESLSQSILETSAPPNSANWNWSARRDRKSTRLNSSHGYISYAVFCLKKKKLHVITASTAAFVLCAGGWLLLVGVPFVAYFIMKASAQTYPIDESNGPISK